MAYKIGKFGENIWTVKGDDDKVALKCKPPTEGPPEARGGPASGEDWEYSTDLARRAVSYVRSALPRGTFNNQMFVKGSWRYMAGVDAPKILAARVETMYAALAFEGDQERDFITQMAARSIATRTVGGGVCSMLTYVTAGWLTMNAKRGTKIVAVFDNQFNHEYCAVYYGHSPWVVADPWVGTSYCCNWTDCCFPRDAIAVTTHIEVGDPVTVPFGVEFTDRAIAAAKLAGKVDVPLTSRDQLAVELQGLEGKKKYTWFHMDGAYGHPDNVVKVKKGSYVAAVLPHQWGDEVS